MRYSTLVIPNLQVLNANAQPHTWLIGPPAITAYAGFAHALVLHLGIDRHLGVGIVHHDVQFLGEADNGTLEPHQFRAASFIDGDDYALSNKYALSSQPSVRCHLSVSLAIRFSSDAITRLDSLHDRVSIFLRSARLAGGSVIDHEFKPDVKRCVFDESGGADEIVRAIGHGYAIHERQDLMKPGRGDRDLLDTLLRLTRQDVKRSGKETWLQPNTLGYAQLTALARRKNVRNGLPHAYAEPLIGLVQYRRLGEYPLPYWRYSRPAPGVFTVTTR